MKISGLAGWLVLKNLVVKSEPIETMYIHCFSNFGMVMSLSYSVIALCVLLSVLDCINSYCVKCVDAWLDKLSIPAFCCSNETNLLNINCTRITVGSLSIISVFIM